MRLLLLLLALPMLAGCVELSLPFTDTVSVGTTGEGWLAHGIALSDEGLGYVRARRGEGTRFGSPEMVGAIERAAAKVRQRYPGGARLVVGDLSSRRGGRHRRHASHESGRDADLLFYAVDAAGRSVRARGFLAYDRFGLGMPRRGEAPAEVHLFDDARNWALVTALLHDESSQVQWIFCSRGLKARLLRYAGSHQATRDELFRASWVLQQPSHGAPHDDHFHVRVRCSTRDVALGCRDRGPEWTWLRGRGDPTAGEALSDAALVRALLDSPDANPLATSEPPPAPTGN